ncbi:AAA family ATPase [Methanobacterium aggregans]|uniref:AAA family ATPase n=1 Tax=Methanobacterium aggregans TaxID=1615586 RepID=UPI001AE754A9|nr:AAA family ATPase [Methanobacterium aggregans]MBP2046738.1 hypothetical protein [Methanobacterium aggregans]
MDITELNSKAENFKKEFEEDFKDSRGYYEEFLSLYPYKEHPETIDSITPEIIYNPGKKPYFLYFIEFGLKDFGLLRCGSARYAENARNDLNSFKKLLKIVVDDSFSIAEKVDAPWEDIKFFGEDKNIAKKIIFCYNPTKILPIYKTKHLEYFASLINEDFNSNKFNKSYENLSLGQKFEYLNDIILKFKEEHIKVEMDTVCFMHFLYKFLPPLEYSDSEIFKDELENKIQMNQRIWKITPGNYEKRNQIWGTLKERGYIGVGWFGCPEFVKMDYSKFESLQEVKDKFAEWYPEGAGINGFMIWNFGKVISKGDIVVANAGYKGILSIGIIESDYISPEEAEKLKIDPDEEYFHFRKVNWLITDELDVDEENFFDRKTVTELKEIKWNKIKEAYIKKSDYYKDIFDFMENNKNSKDTGIKSIEIIKTLFNEFQDTYLVTEEGQEHTEKYRLERAKVKKCFETLKKDKNTAYNLNDPLINYLLPIKEPSIAPAAVSDIRAFGYKKEDLPELTLAIYELISNLLETDDKEVKKQLIQKFKNGPYKKGFQSAMLTPVLYYLDPEYWFINRKTVTTFNFLMKILGTDDKITGELTDYINNNDKLKGLVERLSDEIPELTFELFDAFSHWMCSAKLGNYALDQEKFDKWLKIGCHHEPENKFLKFLETNYNQEMQIALGELKRGRNVIFYGPPGSGKTVLSKILSEKYLEKNAYSLYTVHSGTDYYDLVCRIVPQVTDEGNLIYSKERRFLLDALLSGKVLILDEINRTQIDTALGIFFTYLEKEHRVDDVKQIREILKREIDEEFDLEELKKRLTDFRVVGTLNVYDKTFLFKLGDALKRRFTFVEITTNHQLLNDLDISPEFRREFMDICKYEGDSEAANKIINVFIDLNQIKPLGIGILKETLLFSSYFEEEAADLSISSIMVPFFENDLNFSTIRGILENYGMEHSMRKLESLNFGTSDINGI